MLVSAFMSVTFWVVVVEIVKENISNIQLSGIVLKLLHLLVSKIPLVLHQVAVLGWQVISL